MQSKEIYRIVRTDNRTGDQVGIPVSGWESDPRAALDAYEELARSLPKGQTYKLERVITTVIAQSSRA